jgi:hypothetical protein
MNNAQSITMIKMEVTIYTINLSNKQSHLHRCRKLMEDKLNQYRQNSLDSTQTLIVPNTNLSHFRINVTITDSTF